MRGRYLEILAGRVVTLHSARLPRRMVAEAVVLAQALVVPAQAEEEAVSGQKVPRPVLRERTARAAAAMVAHL